MHGLAKKADLFAVPTAPAANKQVKAYANVLGKGKVSVQSVGLEPGDLTAGWHESSEARSHDRAQALENLHGTTIFLAFWLAFWEANFSLHFPNRERLQDQ